MSARTIRANNRETGPLRSVSSAQQNSMIDNCCYVNRSMRDRTRIGSTAGTHFSATNALSASPLPRLPRLYQRRPVSQSTTAATSTVLARRTRTGSMAGTLSSATNAPPASQPRRLPRRFQRRPVSQSTIAATLIANATATRTGSTAGRRIGPVIAARPRELSPSRLTSPAAGLS